MSLYDAVKRRRSLKDLSNYAEDPSDIEKDVINAKRKTPKNSKGELETWTETKTNNVGTNYIFTKEEENNALNIISVERPDALMVQLNEAEDCSKVGELLWARWNGVQYAAMSVSGKSVHLRPADSGKRWVLWLAEGKVSQLCEDALQSANSVKLLKILSQRKVVPGSLLHVGLIRFGEELLARGDSAFDKSSLTPHFILQRLRRECRFIKPSCVLSEKSKCCLDQLFEKHKISYQRLIWEEASRMRPDSDESLSEDSDNEDYDKEEDDDGRDAGWRIEPRMITEDHEERYRKLREGEIQGLEICLACGVLAHEDEELIIEAHPIFKTGGICTSCRKEYRCVAYASDIDGCFYFCSVCMRGGDLVLCSNVNCGRAFCKACVELLVGPVTWELLACVPEWDCYLCDGSQAQGLLVSWSDWPTRLYNLCQPENFPASLLNKLDNVALTRKLKGRSPLRVLSLFDGISAGMLSLEQTGLVVHTYFASEIDEEAIRVAGNKVQQIGDVRQLSPNKLAQLMPIDLLLGGSPCNDLSIANPWRKGLGGGSGLLFFEFFRVLNELQKIAMSQERPLFWLFENVASMQPEDRDTISRFFGCEPLLLDAKHFSPQHRARFFWGNLPGMYFTETRPAKGAAKPMRLQACLKSESGRNARVSRVRCVTTTQHSGRGAGGLFPVADLDGQEDTLWVSELEVLFGLPTHYTDCNLTLTSRRRLIGKSWCVPMISFLLRPLRQYYATNDMDKKGKNE